MATFVTIFRWTEQGIRGVKLTLDRLEAAKRSAKSMGAEIKAAYYTMGEFDGLVVIDAPSDEVASRFALATGMLGNVRTVTTRAYTEEEFKKILAALS